MNSPDHLRRTLRGERSSFLFVKKSKICTVGKVIITPTIEAFSKLLAENNQQANLKIMLENKRTAEWKSFITISAV